jgi:small nuclear ribonucleoprotein (snRNP)-like protein
LSEDAHVKAILQRHLKTIHGIKDHDLEKHSKELLKEGSDVHNHLLAIRHSSKELEKLEDVIEKHLDHLESFGYRPKHEAASAVRDAVMTQDFKEAHNRLDHLRSLIEEGRKEFARIGEFENSVRHHISIITNNERALERILNHFDKTMRIVSKELSHEKSDENKIRKGIKEHLEKVLPILRNYEDPSIKKGDLKIDRSVIQLIISLEKNLNQVNLLYEKANIKDLLKGIHDSLESDLSSLNVYRRNGKLNHVNSSLIVSLDNFFNFTKKNLKKFN